MGASFGFETVLVGPDEQLQRHTDPRGRFAERLNTMQRIIDGVDPQLRRFRWYSNPCVSGDLERSHCHDPARILKDIEFVDARVAKNLAKFRGEWLFWVPQDDGKKSAVVELRAFYKGRECLPDEQGCWARELGSGERAGLHHELTTVRAVDLQLIQAGPTVSVTLERRPFAVEYPDIVAGIKRVCGFASSIKGLVPTWAE